jgi:hypothetical protein
VVDFASSVVDALTEKTSSAFFYFYKLLERVIEGTWFAH